MNMLQVSPFLKPTWESGGVTRVTSAISRDYIKIRHNVIIFTTVKNDDCTNHNLEIIREYLATNPGNYVNLSVHFVDTMRRKNRGGHLFIIREPGEQSGICEVMPCPD